MTTRNCRDEHLVTIDNRDSTIREFAGMISTFGGGGMRVTFVPNHELHEEPEIVVKEPEEVR